MSSRVPAAAVLTGAAGLIHMAAAVTHVGEAVTLGLLFALAGWAQMVTAVWHAAAHSRAAMTAMSVTNVAALTGWALSRTTGLPVLHPGVEAAGTADVLTTALEVLAIGAVLVRVRGSRSDHTARRALPVGLVAAGVLALGASGAAVAALGSTTGHGHGEVSAGADDGHAHADAEESVGETPAESAGSGASRQPGTLPAALHRHRPGIYHLHEDIELHHHARGIVHVHTTPESEPSPSGDGSTSGTGGSGDHHDDGTGGHTH